MKQGLVEEAHPYHCADPRVPVRLEDRRRRFLVQVVGKVDVVHRGGHAHLQHLETAQHGAEVELALGKRALVQGGGQGEVPPHLEGEVVDAPPVEGLGGMEVGVHQPGHDEPARSVQHAVGRAARPLARHGDAPVLDPDAPGAEDEVLPLWKEQLSVFDAKGGGHGRSGREGRGGGRDLPPLPPGVEGARELPQILVLDEDGLGGLLARGPDVVGDLRGPLVRVHVRVGVEFPARDVGEGVQGDRDLLGLLPQDHFEPPLDEAHDRVAALVVVALHPRPRGDLGVLAAHLAPCLGAGCLRHGPDDGHGGLEARIGRQFMGIYEGDVVSHLRPLFSRSAGGTFSLRPGVGAFLRPAM